MPIDGLRRHRHQVVAARPAADPVTGTAPPIDPALQVGIADGSFGDWDELLQLLQRSFAYMDGRIDPPSSLAAMTVDDLRRKAADERLIVARADGRLVGCAYAAVRGDRLYVGKLAVAAAARGRGIGGRLVDVAESIARGCGLAVLELQTRIELVENHRVFAALGFEPVGETAHPGYPRPTSITMQRRVRPDPRLPNSGGVTR